MIEKYNNLKGQSEYYHDRAKKLQRQLLNREVHRGQNSIKKSKYDQNNHANSDIIANFCKKKVFPHHKFLHTNHGKHMTPPIRPASTTSAVKRLTYQDKWKQIRPKWSTFGLTRQCP